MGRGEGKWDRRRGGERSWGRQPGPGSRCSLAMGKCEKFGSLLKENGNSLKSVKPPSDRIRFAFLKIILAFKKINNISLKILYNMVRNIKEK